MNLEKLRKKQLLLAKSIKILDKDDILESKELKTLSFDVYYKNNDAYVGVVLKYWKSKLIDLFSIKLEIETAYVPSYFCFREGPLLLKALQYLQSKEKINPDLLIVDGHGVAHPRGLGVASWLGLKSNLPSIGCAKSPLLKTPEKGLGIETGSKIEVRNNEKMVGYVLRRKEGINPVYVSAGHLISQTTALQIILEASGAFRIPDSLRFADQIPKFNKIDAKENIDAKTFVIS